MNTVSILIFILVALAANLGFIAWAVHLGTSRTRALLTELVALQMSEAQRRIQQQVENNLHRQVHPNLQQPGPFIPPQPQH